MEKIDLIGIMMSIFILASSIRFMDEDSTLLYLVIAFVVLWSYMLGKGEEKNRRTRGKGI